MSYKRSLILFFLCFLQNQTPAYFEVTPTVETNDLPETNVTVKTPIPVLPPSFMATRRHFKRRLSHEITKKDSLFSELQAVAYSQNISEKIQNKILRENFKMVKEERLFLESQREELVAFERAQREIELDILILERKIKEEIFKRIGSGNCFIYFNQTVKLFSLCICATFLNLLSMPTIG